MANVTQSLFGFTPQDIQAQRMAELDKRTAAFAQLTPMQQAQAGFYRAGSMFGDAAASALGYEDPEIAQARARQGLLGGLDISDPAALRQAAANADPETASLLVNRALEIEKGLADVDAAKALTAQRNRETAAKTSAFGQQLVDAGFTPGSDEYVKQMRRFVEKELTPSKSIGTQIAEGLNPLVVAMAGKQAEAAASKGGQVVGESVAKIRSGEKSLEALKNAKDMLNKGIFAGGYGPFSETLAKYSKGVVGSRERVVNTEEFRSYIGNTVMPMMAMLGGSDSNEELKKMESIMAANTTLEPEAMQNIINSAMLAVERDIKKIQDQQKAVETGQPLPTTSPGRTAVKRWNPQTRQLETITR